jgi:hypothetical protein
VDRQNHQARHSPNHSPTDLVGTSWKDGLTLKTPPNIVQFHSKSGPKCPDKLPQTADPKTTIRIDAENYDWTHFKDIPTIRCVPNNLILTYYHGSLTLTRPTNNAALITTEGHNIVDEKELRDISSAMEGVV